MNYDSLSDDRLLALLESEEHRLPRAAVDETLRRGERLAPRLIEIIDDESLWEAESWAPIHATYILAAMRPPGALEAVMRAVRRSSEFGTEQLWEAIPDMVSSFGRAAIPAIVDALREPDEDLVAALGMIALRSPEARAEVKAALRGLLSDEGTAEMAAWQYLDLVDAGDREVLDSLVQRALVSPAAAQKALEGGMEPREPWDWMKFYDLPVEERERSLEEPYEGDEEMFEADEQAAVREMVGPSSVVDDLTGGDGPGTLERTGPKLGRNDPCPCGSGKKFKKCCGK